MHTTVTCPPAEVTIWQSRLGEDIPAALAAIYRRAADLIREHGHDSRPEGSRWELTSPHSICSASDATAISARPDKIDAEDLGEEAHIRTLMADDCEKISVTGENSRQAVKTASDLLRTLSVTPDREKP